jgi:hypothetical protein
MMRIREQMGAAAAAAAAAADSREFGIQKMEQVGFS